MPGSFHYFPGARNVLNAGDGDTLAVDFTPDDSLNYMPTVASVKIKVTKAHLTVTADDQTRLYGQANPALTYTISGFTFITGPETVTGCAVLATAAMATSSVAGSPYPITIALGTLAAANYDFILLNGALTVNKRT